MQRCGNQFLFEMLHCNKSETFRALKKRSTFETTTPPMSHQLTISSLFSALALVMLVLFVRVDAIGTHSEAQLSAPSSSPIQAVIDLG